MLGRKLRCLFVCVDMRVCVLKPYELVLYNLKKNPVLSLGYCLKSEYIRVKQRFYYFTQLKLLLAYLHILNTIPKNINIT